MRLRIAVPHRAVVDEEVEAVRGEGLHGSFTMFPRHLDWLVVLVPGILAPTRDDVEQYVAVDGGTLVKLSEATRDTVRGAVRDLVSDGDAAVEWEHDSDILAGIQVESEVARLGWTIDGYLDDLLDEFA